MNLSRWKKRDRIISIDLKAHLNISPIDKVDLIKDMTREVLLFVYFMDHHIYNTTSIHMAVTTRDDPSRGQGPDVKKPAAVAAGAGIGKKTDVKLVAAWSNQH